MKIYCLHLLAAASLPPISALFYLLVWAAILAVVIWAFLQLIAWASTKGFVIPRPVAIVFWALLSIVLIVLVARFFGVLV